MINSIFISMPRYLLQCTQCGKENTIQAGHYKDQCIKKGNFLENSKSLFGTDLIKYKIYGVSLPIFPKIVRGLCIQCAEKHNENMRRSERVLREIHQVENIFRRFYNSCQENMLAVTASWMESVIDDEPMYKQFVKQWTEERMKASQRPDAFIPKRNYMPFREQFPRAFVRQREEMLKEQMDQRARRIFQQDADTMGAENQELQAALHILQTEAERSSFLSIYKKVSLEFYAIAEISRPEIAQWVPARWGQYISLPWEEVREVLISRLKEQWSPSD